MARNTTYTHENKDGDIVELNIVYGITPSYAGTHYQPPEPAEIEYHSITHNGVEVEVDEKTLAKIDEQIWNEVENEEPDYDED